MSNYNVGNDELKHYGVKGMKWGVRRSIGVRSRAAALNKTFADAADRNIKRLEAKKATKGLTDRQMQRLKRDQKLKERYTNNRNTLIKDISPKDIKRGERAVMSRLMVGRLYKGIADSIDYNRGLKEIERMRNR